MTRLFDRVKRFTKRERKHIKITPRTPLYKSYKFWFRNTKTPPLFETTCHYIQASLLFAAMYWMFVVPIYNGVRWFLVFLEAGFLVSAYFNINEVLKPWLWMFSVLIPAYMVRELPPVKNYLLRNSFEVKGLRGLNTFMTWLTLPIWGPFWLLFKGCKLLIVDPVVWVWTKMGRPDMETFIRWYFFSYPWRLWPVRGWVITVIVLMVLSINAYGIQTVGSWSLGIAFILLCAVIWGTLVYLSFNVIGFLFRKVQTAWRNRKSQTRLTIAAQLLTPRDYYARKRALKYAAPASQPIDAFKGIKEIGEFFRDFVVSLHHTTCYVAELPEELQQLARKKRGLVSYRMYDEYDDF